MMRLDAGLCGHCIHSRLIFNARGSCFSLCRAAETHAELSRYPSLPVLSCALHYPGVPMVPENQKSNWPDGDG